MEAEVLSALVENDVIICRPQMWRRPSGRPPTWGFLNAWLSSTQATKPRHTAVAGCHGKGLQTRSGVFPVRNIVHLLARACCFLCVSHSHILRSSLTTNQYGQLKATHHNLGIKAAGVSKPSVVCDEGEWPCSSVTERIYTSSLS